MSILSVKKTVVFGEKNLIMCFYVFSFDEGKRAFLVARRNPEETAGVCPNPPRPRCGILPESPGGARARTPQLLRRRPCVVALIFKQHTGPSRHRPLFRRRKHYPYIGNHKHLLPTEFILRANFPVDSRRARSFAVSVHCRVHMR